MCNKLLKGQISGKFVPLGSLGISASVIALFVFSLLYQKNIDSSQLISIGSFLFDNIFGILISISLFSLSIFSGIYIVPLYSIMQHRSNSKHLARIVAANNVMNALFMVLASIFTILLFSCNLNINQIFLIVGIANFAIFFITRNIVNKNLNNA
jgi:hypothetical protein